MGPEGDWPLLESKAKKADLRMRSHHTVAVESYPVATHDEDGHYVYAITT